MKELPEHFYAPRTFIHQTPRRIFVSPIASWPPLPPSIHSLTLELNVTSLSLFTFAAMKLLSEVDIALDLVELAACEAWYWLPISMPPNDVAHCPLTLSQVLLDPRFAYDWLSLLLYQGESCYETTVPSLSGGGQECCYNGGHLVIGAPSSSLNDNKTSRWRQCGESEPTLVAHGPHHPRYRAANHVLHQRLANCEKSHVSTILCEATLRQR